MQEYDEEGLIPNQGFDRIAIYDAPNVAFTQFLDDEATFKSFKQTFFSPEQLSPMERDSYVDRLKKQYGGTGLSDALIDLATNPFVWLTFVTSPAGASSIKATGRIFSGRKYSEFVGGNQDVLKSLGLLNAHQMGEGSALPTVLNSLTRRIDDLVEKEQIPLRPTLKNLQNTIGKKFGLKEPITTLSPDRAPVIYANINGEYISLPEYLKKSQVYMHAVMDGMNKQLVRKQSSIGFSNNVVTESGKKIPVTREQAGDIHAMLRDLDEGVLPPQQFAAATSRILGVTPSSKTVTTNLTPVKYSSARRAKNSYEVSSAGDKRFSAMTARLSDGKTIEDAYQALKGSGKGQPAVDPNFDYYGTYKGLWSRWAKENPGLMEELASKAKGKTLTDKFANTENNQARALAEILTEQSPKTATKTVVGEFDLPVRVARGSRVTGEVKSGVRQNLDPDNLMQQWLEREGFAPLMGMTRNVMKDRYADLFYNAKGQFDDNKILRLYSNLKKSVTVAKQEDVPFLASEYFGHVNNEMAEEIVKGLRSGKMKLNEFKQVIKDQRSLDDLENYMPRNVWSNVMADGTKIRTDKFVDPRAKGNYSSGRIRDRSVKDGIYDPEDLDQISELYRKAGKANPNLENFIGRNQELMERSFKSGPQDGVVQVSNLDFQPALQKYLKQTRNDVALYADEISPDIKVGLKDYPLVRAKDARKDVQAREVLGGKTRYDTLQTLTREFDIAGDKATSSYIQGVLIPRIKGDMKINDLLGYHAMLGTQKIAKGLVDSPFMKKVSKENAESNRFVGAMKSFAQRDLTEFDGSNFGRGATTALYSSHLGFNPASAVLNLFQPLLFAQTWMGAGNMAKGYGQSIKQYFNYIGDRVKLPMRGNADEIDELRRKHFRLSNVDGEDLLNIRSSSYELLDQVAFATVGDKDMGKFKYFTTELPLKLFQHTEIFNRVATGEAALAAMQTAGKVRGIKGVSKKGLTDYSFMGKSEDLIRGKDNIKSFVQNTQFGSDIVNSPAAFQSGVLALPWVRQFLTFPMRTFTSWTNTAPMINQGRRTWGATGFQTQGKFSAMFHDMARTLGTSAVVYEVGKNALGMDFSKGLGAQTLFESSIVGPLVLSDRKDLGYKLPIPPVIDIALDGSNALMQEDKSLIGALLPRVIPGGISFQRALNMAPRIGSQEGFVGGLQREFTDFNQINAEGQVAIYRADGSLLKQESAIKRIFSSVGLGPYLNRNDQELHKFLVTNKQQHDQIKSEFISARESNNFEKANRIALQFEKKFGIPLTVTEQQVKKHRENQMTELRDRMVGRMNPQVRGQYQNILEQERGGTVAPPPAPQGSEQQRMSPGVFDSYGSY